MDLKNRTFHLPVKSAPLSFKASNKRNRQSVERGRQVIKPAQIPSGHVNGDAPNSVSILTADELLHEKLRHTIAVEIASIFSRQTTKYFCVRPAGARNAALRSRSEERRVGKECRSRWSPYI